MCDRFYSALVAAVFENHELGLSWLADSGERMERACHAVAAPGPDGAADAVWVIDPVDVEGLDQRIVALGEPAGVIQLLDRHDRDCSRVAERLAVTRHRVPFDGVPGSPFEAIAVVRNRLWNEVALWWPQRRALIVPEAVGTSRYFRAGDEPVGVHPMMRLVPPRDQLGGLEPLHLLTGHGTGMHGPETPAALAGALANARKRMPNAAISILRSI